MSDEPNNQPYPPNIGQPGVHVTSLDGGLLAEVYSSEDAPEKGDITLAVLRPGCVELRVGRHYVDADGQEDYLFEGVTLSTEALRLLTGVAHLAVEVSGGACTTGEAVQRWTDYIKLEELLRTDTGRLDTSRENQGNPPRGEDEE